MATQTGSPSVSSWQGEGNEVRRGASAVAFVLALLVGARDHFR